MPADTWHFLWNWDWSDKARPTPYKGNESLPVTYVGLDEARPCTLGYPFCMGQRVLNGY